MSTPRWRLRRDMARLAGAAGVPGWLRPLAEGDVSTLRRLAEAFRVHHDLLLAPWRDRIAGAVAADQARRARLLAGGGVEAMFAGLRPWMRWRFPVLEVDYPETRDLVLGGRGLLLVPSFFCFPRPVSLADPRLRPQLLYPVDQELRWSVAVDDAASSLVALLGANRARLLRAVDAGATTSQLAERVGTTLSSASRHAAVLRSAGLVASVRDQNAVCHSLTPLGRSLLTAGR
jgi:DNA-binding transcriptional ArsR family regulator